MKREDREPFLFGRAEVLCEGKDVLLLAVGNMVEKALAAADILKSRKIFPTIVNMRFVKPFDEDLVRRLAVRHRVIVTMEDNVASGGFGEKIKAFLLQERIYHRCVSVCFPDRFVEHGLPEELYEKYGMDAASVAEKVSGVVQQ